MVVKIMKKEKYKINYFVGPYGSGKSTLLDNITMENPGEWVTSYEDQSMISFLKNPEVRDRQSFYINVAFYKLKRSIDKLYFLKTFKNPRKGILYDGHPLLGVIYARTFFEMEMGKTISYPEWGLLNRQHTRLYNFVKKQGFLDDFDQTIYYINIPFDENWKNVLKRGRENTDEIDEWYLMNLRRILHQEIYGLADYYNTQLIELNSLEEINNLSL